MRRLAACGAYRALSNKSHRLFVDATALTEPLRAAERLLRHTLEHYPSASVATSTLPTPLRLAETRSGGVRVVLTTPSDCHVAGVLQAVLSERRDWSVQKREESSVGSNQGAYRAILVAADHRLLLSVPHTLETLSTADAPMLARPRLQQGTVTFEAPRLSVGMARAIVSAASVATSELAHGNTDDRQAGGQAGGPLAALERLVQSYQPPREDGDATGATSGTTAGSRSRAADSSATSHQASGGPSAQEHERWRPSKPFWVNETAANASAANAAVHGTINLPKAGSGGARRAEGSRATSGGGDAAEVVMAIEDLGARVLMPPSGGAPDAFAGLAGAQSVREAIEETLLLPIAHPEAFAAVLRETRASAVGEGDGAPRPTAVLFHGPPGTGKSQAARMAAAAAALPLVACPLESLTSKWYGEGEAKLAALFGQCEALGRCVLFLDEIDALGGSRDRELHEASRRMLSVRRRRRPPSDPPPSCALRCVDVMIPASWKGRPPANLVLPTGARPTSYFLRPTEFFLLPIFDGDLSCVSATLGTATPPGWLRCGAKCGADWRHQPAVGPRRGPPLAV